MLPASNNRSPKNGWWTKYKVLPLSEGVSLADDAAVPAAFLLSPEQSPHREARQQIDGSCAHALWDLEQEALCWRAASGELMKYHLFSHIYTSIYVSRCVHVYIIRICFGNACIYRLMYSWVCTFTSLSICLRIDTHMFIEFNTVTRNQLLQRPKSQKAYVRGSSAHNLISP